MEKGSRPLFTEIVRAKTDAIQAHGATLRRERDYDAAEAAAGSRAASAWSRAGGTRDCGRRGAVGVAGIAARAVSLDRGPIVAVVSGSNIDMHVLAPLLR
ncbi:MAG: hypothetical protein HYU53_14945 [Acidobacteria bacterium]|nr:hypothetical protein [Acidobacteriota bacterium]